MLEFYSTNKWYVDGQLPNHNEIAQAVAAQFPHLRLAIGPTTLNSSYKGADKAQIESVVQSMGGLKAPGAGSRALASNVEAPAGNSPPDAPASVNQGDMVLVIMPGIGEVVATFVRMQGTNAVVDLDGIEEVVAFSALAPLPPADSTAPSVPPEPPAPPVEAKAPSVPPTSPIEAKAPSVPPVEVKAPPADASAANEPPPADADASSSEQP